MGLVHLVPPLIRSTCGNEMTASSLAHSLYRTAGERALTMSAFVLSVYGGTVIECDKFLSPQTTEQSTVHVRPLIRWVIPMATHLGMVQMQNVIAPGTRQRSHASATILSASTHSRAKPDSKRRQIREAMLVTAAVPEARGPESGVAKPLRGPSCTSGFPHE